MKGYKAIGKRITTLHIDKVEELEPLRFPEETIPEPPVEEDDSQDEPDSSDNSNNSDDSTPSPDSSEDKSQQDLADEMNGQLSFDF